MKHHCFCSVVSLSHLEGAVALARSLQDSGNPEKLHLLVTDLANEQALLALPENIQLHGLRETAADLPPLAPFYFDKFELCNALKPFLVRHLFRKGLRQVIYLDTDIFAVGSFGPVWEILKQTPVVLTPHQLEAPDLQHGDNAEISLVDQGIYNGGFSAWQAGDKAEQVLDWMCSRFPVYGFNRRSQGMFVDQKLLPLLPIYFPKAVLVWRDPAVNIAYWNVQERKVEVRNTEYRINEQPVVFFHMSGYRVEFPLKACSYLGEEANQRVLQSAPWFRGVMERYGRLLCAAKTEKKTNLYKFDSYRGIRLSPNIRMLLFKKQGNIKWYSLEVLWLLFIDHLRLFKRLGFRVITIKIGKI